MKDESAVGLAGLICREKSPHDESCAVADAKLEADDLAGEDVDDDAEIDTGSVIMQFRHVADPESVWRGSRELAFVLSEPVRKLPAHALVFAAGGVAVAFDVQLFHDAADGCRIGAVAFLLELEGDHVRAIGSVAFLEDALNFRHQFATPDTIPRVLSLGTKRIVIVGAASNVEGIRKTADGVLVGEPLHLIQFFTPGCPCEEVACLKYLDDGECLFKLRLEFINVSCPNRLPFFFCR